MAFDPELQNYGILLVGNSEERTMIGDAEQYQELVTLYSTYGDDELRAFGRDLSDLTATAQEVLKAEIARRGLKITPATEPVEDLVLTDEDLSDMRAYAELAQPEGTFESHNGGGERAPTSMLA